VRLVRDDVVGRGAYVIGDLSAARERRVEERKTLFDRAAHGCWDVVMTVTEGENIVAHPRKVKVEPWRLGPGGKLLRLQRVVERPKLRRLVRNPQETLLSVVTKVAPAVPAPEARSLLTCKDATPQPRLPS
jgi:hypothetical protein